MKIDGVESILVVDDNDLDVEKVQRSFRQLGVSCDLMRARDGLEALDAIRTWDQRRGGTPGAILLDINMPRMTGLELLGVLDDEMPELRVPIFVATTSNDPADISAAERHAICGYIVKPVSTTEASKLLRAAERHWRVLSAERVCRGADTSHGAGTCRA